MYITEEEKVADVLGDYLSQISCTEEYIELTPEEQQFKEAVDVCWEILKRTKLLRGIVIERPDELKEVWEEDDPAYDFMQKYPSGVCEIADDVLKKVEEKLRRCG